MEGNSKYLRLSAAAAVAALLAAGVAMMAMSGSAQAVVYANDVTIRVVDNSAHHSASVALCPRGHVSIDYEFGTRADPCNRITETHFIGANGGRYPEGPWPGTTYTANPLGVIVRLSGQADRPLYFYVKNPTLGLPFFEASRGPMSCTVGSPCRHEKIRMVQGELQTRNVGGVLIRFHREGDINGGLSSASYKVMTIEICGAAGTRC